MKRRTFLAGFGDRGGRVYDPRSTLCRTATHRGAATFQTASINWSGATGNWRIWTDWHWSPEPLRQSSTRLAAHLGCRRSHDSLQISYSAFTSRSSGRTGTCCRTNS